MNTLKDTNKARKALGGDQPAIPCGLVAKSFFNDTFELHGANGRIEIDEQKIAWSSDVEFKFKNIEENKPDPNSSW